MMDIRWKQRFNNFDRAFVLLREVQERGKDSLSQLEKEGAIQRFEFAFELAWKTLRSCLAKVFQCLSRKIFAQNPQGTGEIFGVCTPVRGVWFQSEHSELSFR